MVAMRTPDDADAVQLPTDLLSRLKRCCLSFPLAASIAIFLLVALALMTVQMRFSATLLSDTERGEGRFTAHAGLQPKRAMAPTASDECISRVCLWNRNYLFRPSYSKTNPCEDFYEHVCGGFRYSPGGFSQQPYPRWSTGQLLLNFDRFFKRFLAVKGQKPRPIESNFLVQAMWVHEKCMTGNASSESLSDWPKILEALGLSGWPFLEFNGDLVAAVSSGDRYLMLQTLYRVILLRSAHRQAPPHVILRRPLTYLERFAALSKQATAKRYEDIIIRAVSFFGNKTVGDTVGREISKLEWTLRNLTQLKDSDVEYAPNDLWSVDMLPGSEHWDWLRYMRLLFKTETLVTGRSVVYMEDPLFFARLSSVFGTPKYETAVANYIGLKALVTFWPFMTREFRPLYEFGLGSDIDHFDPKLAACGALLENMFRYGVGVAAKLTLNREFANVYRTHHDDQLAELFNESRSAIRDMLQSGRSWFAHDDMATALRKLDNMTFVYGTQENFAQYEHYRRTQRVELDSKKNVLETVFSIFSYSSSLYWEALGNADGGNVTAAYDNAYTTSIFAWDSEYQSTNNIVFAPNGLLGFLSTISSTIPFHVYPAVLSSLIRASLQAFVRSNSLFDDRMLPEKWWSAESSEEYENITHCLRQQYEAADTEGNEGYGRSSASTTFSPARLESDFLDNAILWPLYELYEQALIRHNATRLYYTLPYVRVSAREMFFYNYAWVFCDNSIEPSRKLQQSVAITPAKLRLNVALSNFPPFLRTFSCTERNETQSRCEVWKRFE